MKFSLVFKWLTPESKPVVPLDWCPVKRETRVLSFSLCNDFLAVYSSNESFWSYHMKNKWELVPEQVTQAIDKSWLNENIFPTVCSVQCLPRTETSLSRLPSVPFPWSLAVHHQSLASTLRKTKRLRRRLVQCVTDFSCTLNLCTRYVSGEMTTESSINQTSNLN